LLSELEADSDEEDDDEELEEELLELLSSFSNPTSFNFLRVY
jgi:predicted site-specific integrase-resolvase